MSFWNWLFRPRPPQPPVIPPAPQPVQVRLSVWADGVLTTAGDAQLVCDQYPDRVFTARVAPEANRWLWELPPDAKPWGAMLTLSGIPDYEPVEQRVVIDPDLPDVGLVPFGVDLPALMLNGRFFATVAGPLTLIEATDFQLFQRYLNGEDIGPVLEQRADTGFNCVRVLGMCRNMFRLEPYDYGDRYYQALPEFVQECERYGLYVEFVVFADAAAVMPNHDAQRVHYARVCQAVPYTTTLLELVNENNHPSGINRIDTDRFPKPQYLLSSHGSNGSGDEPVRPAWDYETFHYNDLPEWQRKTAHNPMEDSDRVATANENTRFPDRCDRTDLAEAAAAGAALLHGGACFHSVSGKTSTLWTGRELACAQAWARGARSVPLWAQQGFYTHRTDLENAQILRAYSRTVPGVGEHVVLIPY